MTMSLVTALILIGAGLLQIAWGVHELRRYLDYRHLDKAGETTIARVLSISNTGTTVNKQPQVRVELEVVPVGAFAGQPYRAEVTAVVSQVKLAAMSAPGAVVRVRYDPKDPKRVVLD